jgi:hypothetical protein
MYELNNTHIGTLKNSKIVWSIYKKWLKEPLDVSDRVSRLYGLLDYLGLYTYESDYENLSLSERSKQFAFYMYKVLHRKEELLEKELVALKTRYNDELFDESYSADEVVWAVRVKLNDEWNYFFCPMPLLGNKDRDWNFEGSTAKGYKLNSGTEAFELRSVFEWPKSNYSENREEVFIWAIPEMDGMGISSLNLELNHKIIGERKDHLLFASITDLDKDDFLDKLPGKTRKKILKKTKKNYRGKLSDYKVEDYFSSNMVYGSEEYLSFSMSSSGMSVSEPAYEYHMKLARDKMISENEGTVAINFGALIHEQLYFDKEIESRNRKHDYSFQYPRSYKYTAKLIIPKGYKLESDLDYWNSEVENEYGFYKSSISQSGDTITFWSEKAYKTYIVPLEEADKLYAFAEAARRFYFKRIVLSRDKFITEKKEALEVIPEKKRPENTEGNMVE